MDTNAVRFHFGDASDVLIPAQTPTSTTPIATNVVHAVSNGKMTAATEHHEHQQHREREQRWKHHLQPPILALGAAFTDTVTYVGLFGLFSTHVTGNLIIAGATVASGSSDVVSKLVALPVFALACAIVSIMVQSTKPPDRPALFAPFMLGEACFLAISMGLAEGLRPLTSADAYNTILPGMFAVFAMGIRNGLTKHILKNFIASTVMTGNVTQLATDVALLATKMEAKQREAVLTSVAKTAPSVLGFVVGAALGAVGYRYCSFWCLSLPIAIDLVFAFFEWSKR